MAIGKVCNPPNRDSCGGRNLTSRQAGKIKCSPITHSFVCFYPLVLSLLDQKSEEKFLMSAVRRGNSSYNQMYSEKWSKAIDQIVFLKGPQVESVK